MRTFKRKQTHTRTEQKPVSAKKRHYVDLVSSKNTTSSDFYETTNLPIIKYDNYQDVGVKFGDLISEGIHSNVYLIAIQGINSAIKIFSHTHYSADRNEAEIQHLAQHPNIVRLMSFLIIGHNDNQQYGLATEYCDKGPLCKYVVNNPVDSSQSLRTQFVSDIIKGLAYLHDMRIIHGDIHLSNIFLTTADNDEKKIIAKIGDFGLSHYLRNEDDKAYNVVTVHTQYAPPEILKDEKPFLTFASDIFSLGHVLHLLTQDKTLYPLPGELYEHDGGPTLPHAKLINYILNGSVQAMPLKQEHSSVPMQALILSCFKTDYTQRPMADTLDKKLGEKNFSVFKNNN